MGIQCGIVGLPNVGKSTLFNALTKAGIAAANYPFCTIEPNVGVVPVPDPRLQQLADIVQAAEDHSDHGRVRRHRRPGGRRVEGRRPGQQVPRPHPRGRRDRPRGALLRGRRTSIHVAGKVDPIADIEIIDTELALADLESVDKALQRAERAAKANDKEALAKKPVLQKLSAALQRRQARAFAGTDRTRRQALVRDLFLLTQKPVMYIANVRRGRLREQPACSTRCARAPQRKAPKWCRCARRSRPKWPQLDDADRDDVPARHGPGRAGPEPRDPRRPTSCSACRPISPPA